MGWGEIGTWQLNGEIIKVFQSNILLGMVDLVDGSQLFYWSHET